MGRPNILVIQADQLTAKVLPMYGGPHGASATPQCIGRTRRDVCEQLLQ